MQSQLLQAVVDLAPDGFLVVDPSGRIAFANRHAEQLFGYATEELIGKTIEYLVPERFRETHSDHQAAYRVHPRTRPMGAGLELHARRADGSEVPVEISLSPVTTGEGTFVTAVVRDITERKALEQARRRSEERYRLLAEQARDIIFRIRLVPPPPRIEYMSPASRPLTGYLPGDHYADPDLLVSMTDPEHQPLIRQLMSDPESVPNPFMVRIRKRDGEMAWQEQQFTVIHDADGQPVAIEGIARDTTQRVIAEEERQRLAAMTELQYDRERIARDLHDGVMQAIYGVGLNLIDAKERMAKSPPESVDILDQSVEELRQVIEDIRRYVMGLPLERLGEDLPRIINRQLTDLRAHSGIRTHITAPEDMPTLTEHQTSALLHIAREALANVRKHAQAQNVSVHLQLEAHAIILLIQDDGVGFDHNAERSDDHLGLRNMHARAQELTGVFEVDGRIGEGTIVRFRLPLGPESLSLES